LAFEAPGSGWTRRRRAICLRHTSGRNEYDSLSAEQVTSRLLELSQLELSKIHAYEKRHQDRKTVLDKIAALRAQEPWPGYDELTVADIRRAISEIDDDARIAAVRNYEQRHKQRQGVIELTERKPAERGSQRS
jgi:hypothetical protein